MYAGSQVFGFVIRCPACGAVNNVKADGQTYEMHKDYILNILRPGFVCHSCSKSVTVENAAFQTSP